MRDFSSSKAASEGDIVEVVFVGWCSGQRVRWQFGFSEQMTSLVICWGGEERRGEGGRGLTERALYGA